MASLLIIKTPLQQAQPVSAMCQVESWSAINDQYSATLVKTALLVVSLLTFGADRENCSLLKLLKNIHTW